ncbi:hypothetical protein A2U01_0083786, partial [Trifolium medium]|nr:hypothetical protein [Trifolium medium]
PEDSTECDPWRRKPSEQRAVSVASQRRHGVNGGGRYSPPHDSDDGESR